jgi:hypothetical protein
MPKKLRLLKVVCQPVFVLDDGENLTEQAAEPIQVPAADWPAFAERLEAERIANEDRLNATGSGPT